MTLILLKGRAQKNLDEVNNNDGLVTTCSDVSIPSQCACLTNQFLIIWSSALEPFFHQMKQTAICKEVLKIVFSEDCLQSITPHAFAALVSHKD